MYSCTVWILSLLSIGWCAEYREDGQFLIGSILPLSKASGAGKCAEANPKGIAVAEAYIDAVDRIKKDSAFSSLSIGYYLTDSCGDLDIERKLAYGMSTEALAHKQNTSASKSADIVLSEFTKMSLKSLNVLNVEGIPQISYVSDNARLMKDASIPESSIKMLASAYPENIQKILTVVDIIDEFKFKFVHAVVSDNYQGRAGLNLLATELKKKKISSSDHQILSGKADVNKAIAEFEKNRLITVVVVDCDKSVELELYKQVDAKGMKHLIFISTQDWHLSQDSLKPYISVLEGMIYINSKVQYSVLQNYFLGPKVQIPFTGKGWLKPLFFDKGGKEECLASKVLGTGLKTLCEKAEKDTKIALSEHADVAIHAFVSTYIIAHALKAKKQDQTLMDAFKALKFRIPLLPEDMVILTDRLTAESSNFMVYNIHGNSSQSFDSKWLGAWTKENNLRITKTDVRWKEGNKETPISTCTKPCAVGFIQMINKDNCWSCKKCPNGTISNVTNSDECISCPVGKSAKPDQSQCVQYKLISFAWFSPMGSFIIFLIVLGICAALFALGIFSQNSDHEVVLFSGYKLLCLFILGCLLLFLSPVPLLITPTVESCSSYIALFNLAITLCFSILISRSAYINGYYNDDNEVIKSGCGPIPRVITIAIVLGIQVLIMVIGLMVAKPDTMHRNTDKWDERYFECSSWNSYVFWVGLGYNIALSIVGNFFSCTSTKMEENCEELKYILITFCLFYLFGIFEIVIFYRYVDSALAEGQAVMCIIFGFIFFFSFLWPKIFIILFRSKKDGKHIQPMLLSTEEGDHHIHSTVHAADGFRHHGVVQMKIKEESIDDN